MENSEEKRVIYEFDGFLLDPDERTLTFKGQEVHLPAKEFDTLVYLVRNNGRALSKDELMSAIWQDSFVEESNLAKQISRLRKLLSAGGRELIETIPKHGYRLRVADMRSREAAASEPTIIERRTVQRVKVTYPEAFDEIPVERSGAALPPSDRGRRLFWFATAGIVLTLAVVATYFWLSGNFRPTGDSRVKSLAVLPFRSVTSDSTDEPLRFGVTDALITKLSNLRKIVVRPTNAVRNYRDRDSLEAGRALSVDAVLDGNIQRDGRTIRVTVQLVRVEDGKILWGGKFDEEFTDIFAVQDAISNEVARALEPGLTGDEKDLIAKRHTTNPEAHEAYVQGRYYWNRRTGRDIRESIRYFNDAITKDPEYALAFAGLADAYSLSADYNAARPSEVYPKAREAALRALELDDSLAEAHTSLAYVKMYYYWDRPGAESSYLRAIELNPNYATAHQWYSEFLTSAGRFDEALASIRRAREIDPLSPVINAGEVWTLYFARRYDEAIERGRRLQQMDPAFAEVNEYLKRSYDQKGMYREAIAARQMRRKLVGLDATESETLKKAAGAQAAAEYWQQRLVQELEEAETEGPAAFDLAEIYSQLGDRERAFEWLERAVENRHYAVIYLKVAPNFDPLRGDMRFGRVLERLGLNT